MIDDVIRLRLPARPEYGRVARIAAAQLAVRRGFSLREVDDLRLAMDEAVILVLGPAPEPGSLEVEYGVRDDELVVALSTSPREGEIPQDRIERFGELAGELLSSYEVDPAHGVRLTKTTARRT